MQQRLEAAPKSAQSVVLRLKIHWPANKLGEQSVSQDDREGPDDFQLQYLLNQLKRRGVGLSWIEKRKLGAPLAYLDGLPC